MFYVKKKIKGKVIRIDIDYDNVFIKCSECGKEIEVDLIDVVQRCGDLHGISVICGKCSPIEEYKGV